MEKPGEIKEKKDWSTVNSNGEKFFLHFDQCMQVCKIINLWETV